MKTILRKIITDDSELFVVIDHDLSNFKLKIMETWQLSEHKESSFYRVNRGISLPSYIPISTVNNADEDINNLADIEYNIVDNNNLFYKLYNAFKKINPIELLNTYKDYKWVFDKKSIYLDNGSKVLSILEPFKYWEGNLPEDNRIYYNNKDSVVMNDFLNSSDKWLVGVDIDKYPYVVFRTAWYDIVIYTEYVILQLKALNSIFNIFNKWTDTDIKILENPIERTNSDRAIDWYTDALKNEIEKSRGLNDLYNIINNSKVNRGIKVTYTSVIAELDFFDEKCIDWKVFEKVYKNYFDKYVFTILLYMRWNFIKSRVDIPSEFNRDMIINTPLGRLLMKGGNPTWIG